ncbi:membrane protein-like protein [Marinobacter manganoxydans MnI7-9]|uniref:Membrane protein-like protein n=2 Tax=Marinobacteraceae TaxID=2887365 RepID=G6YTW4_9GAMM|nr:membrane protein-like protein [Marinobacter manganoxydans MnI7-9]
MVEPAINTVAYFFHEKIWARRQRNTRVPEGTLSEARPHIC